MHNRAKKGTGQGRFHTADPGGGGRGVYGKGGLQPITGQK